MSNSEDSELTDLARFFLEPSNTTHRQYEALRAYFVEHLPSAEAARRFGYTPGSFRVLCHEFRRNPRRPFFLSPVKSPQAVPKKEPVRGTIVALRKQNLSIYDISRALAQSGQTLSPPAVAMILKQEGFARLPRRRDEERPPGTRPEVAAVANVGELDLTPRQFRTKFGGLFLFMPFLAAVPLDKIFHQADLPGSGMIPAGQAMRSLLALKLFGNARHSHVMSSIFDEGLALFAGLNDRPMMKVLKLYALHFRMSLLSALVREAVFGQVASNGTGFTGIALVNSNPEEGKTTIDIFDRKGKLVRTTTEVIPPRAAGPAFRTSPSSIWRDLALHCHHGRPRGCDICALWEERPVGAVARPPPDGAVKSPKSKSIVVIFHAIFCLSAGNGSMERESQRGVSEALVA